MSEVVDTESGPKVEIQVEEATISGIPTPSFEGDANVEHGDMTKN